MFLGPEKEASLGKTRFSCSQPPYLDWWLKAIELSGQADGLWFWYRFTCSSLIPLISFPLQLQRNPGSTSREDSAPGVTSFPVPNTETAEQLGSFLHSNCKIPWNKPGLSFLWLQMMPCELQEVKSQPLRAAECAAASQASPAQSPNSDSVKAPCAKQTVLANFPSFLTDFLIDYLELINPLISCALRVRSAHIWAINIKASLHFPCFWIVAMSVAHGKTNQEAPTLLPRDPQLCITPPLKILFPV